MSADFGAPIDAFKEYEGIPIVSADAVLDQYGVDRRF